MPDISSRLPLAHSLRFLKIVALLLAALLALVSTALPAGSQTQTALPLIVTGADSSAASDAPLVQAQAGKLFLPMVSAGARQITTEEYTVSYDQESTIVALGGRVKIHIPKEAVPYFNNTLTVMSPNPQAAWLELYIYIINRPGSTYPIHITELYKPITLTLDYSKVDLTYLDETRLTVAGTPSYDWVPPIGEATTLAEDAAPQADRIWQTSVNVAEKRVILNTNRAFIAPRLAVGYSISDMASGPGNTIYAAAAPIIYTVNGNGTLARVVNLDEVSGAVDLHTSLTRFAVNTQNGDIYLALRGKAAGAALKVYALNGQTLRELYTVPDGEEVWAFAYRPQDNALYLGMAKIVGYWFGCPTRDNWIRAIDASNGTKLGSSSLGETNYLSPIAALSVNTAGHILATQPTVGCDPREYRGSQLLTGSTTDTSARLTAYPGFRDANYLASDGQGRTFVANQSADVISVLAGTDSEVVGSLAIEKPGPLAVAGNTLYVVANGRITTIPLSRITSQGNEVKIIEETLSGTTGQFHVTADGFGPIPAHNVLYYNGARYFMSYSAEYGYSGQETELVYQVGAPQPQPVRYKPLTDQHATITFKMNGALVASKTIVAPETPYLDWQYGDYATGPHITIAQDRWARLVFVGSLSSQEGLFPEIPAYGNVGQAAFIHFNRQGEFHFLNKEEGAADKLFTATVDTYGNFDATVQTIDPATGGVLWRGGAAFEIPAGALPDQPGGYNVSFVATANGLPLNDAVSARSPIYTFSFTPEVLHLNQALSIHLPSYGDVPVLAFYDRALNDPYTIPSVPDPSAATHTLFTLPAGDYPPADAESLAAAQAVQPQAAQASWLRRGLNWLGQTGIWHAVGLPNDKLETQHFVILFNTKDCSPAYAGTLLDALEDAYAHFAQRGAIMPAEPVYVKIAPWVATTSTPGVTPGIGSLFHFYMFMNNSLSTEALQDTAVHEFMHVLQKTNALVDGRYMNPLWWEEATATWAQYEIYPSHTTYYLDIQGEGERWLRHAYSGWNSMSTAEMYAAMSLAEYLTQKHGDAAVFSVFQNLGVELGNVVDVAEAIEKATGKKFDDFYEEFAQAYWLQTFEPVKSWTFLDSLTGADKPKNAILPVTINQPVNAVLSMGNIPQLSSGLLKIYAIDPLPVSFTRDTGATTGSMASIANTCTGNNFYFLDEKRSAIPNLKFAGEMLPGWDELYYDRNLGTLTSSKPLYLLYIDRSCKYNADCTPTVKLEQPTLSSLSPSSVQKNKTVAITISGEGFGPNQGKVAVAYNTLPDANILSWTPTVISFTWETGSTPGTVTVHVYSKKGARSNGVTLTITP